MKLFPAIDVYQGRAVRLLRGDRSKVTDYGNALSRAKEWGSCGANYLHIVDLDGAQSGVSTNYGIISDIASVVGIPIQVGGGIRSIETIERYFASGVTRVIIGTSALTDEKFCYEAIARFGNKIVLGVDAKCGKVAINGWNDYSDVSPLQLIEKYKVKTAVYTDISRDGAMTGVDIDGTYALQKESKIDIIASGGVNSMQDLVELDKLGVYGAIIGKAIYTGDIDLAEAIEKVEKKC